MHIEVILRSRNYALHLLYCGFDLLEQAGKLSVRYSTSPDYDESSNGPAILFVRTDDGRTVAYDLGDDTRVDSSIDLDLVEYCFKRSYSENVVSVNLHKDKIKPLGFAYDVMAPKAMAFRRAILNRSKVNVIKEIVKGSRFLSCFTNAQSTVRTCSIDRFEAAHGNFTLPPRVIFLTRLWDPMRAGDSGKGDMRAEINNTRLEVVRLLKRNLGGESIVGLVPTKYSKEKYSELCVSKAMTARANYIKRMTECVVGVSTNGLERTNQFKIAEYVAAGRGVVSERNEVVVTGEFLEDINFKGFSSAEECLIKITDLLSDEDALSKMMADNVRYYWEHLEPSAIVWNSLHIIEKN